MDLMTIFSTVAFYSKGIRKTTVDAFYSKDIRKATTVTFYSKGIRKATVDALGDAGY